MATLIAFEAFDINYVDLNWYDYYADESALEDNVNATIYGQTYSDWYWVTAYDGFDYLELDFLGYGFQQDVQGNITAGTVNFVAEYDILAGTDLWYVEGISVSAVAIYNAALTVSNADELSLIVAALGGDDTIVLSNYADRMSGYAGNDQITGGLGSDILSGGSGNDTFRDTRAGLNGDTITDFAAGEKLVFTDATLGSFTFNLTGNTLTYSGGSVTLQGSFSGLQLVASSAAGGGVQLTLQAATAIADVRNDFNGDGRSDILWRSESGQLSNWLGQANGGFVNNDANAFTTVSTDWWIVGAGDFNGDGRDDILWWNEQSQMSNWLGQANGGFVNNDANAFRTVAEGWDVVGIGDFNGDGRDDILWRSATGQLSNWLGQANGGFVNNDANAFSTVPLDWQVVGTGDFNGDGRDDILWRSQTGQLSNWLGTASGGFINNDANAFATVPTNWTTVATGDFNGDGRDDILWRSNSGELSNWLGTASGGWVNNDANAFTTVSTDWHVVAVGDYNGDGRDDILWRRYDGALSDWLGQANGGFVNNDANAYAFVPNNWDTQPESPLV